MTEKEYAKMEAAANFAEDEFFKHRLMWDAPLCRQIFNLAFKRGWKVNRNHADKRIKELEDGIRKCANLEGKTLEFEITEAEYAELCCELEEARKYLFKQIGIES